MAECDCETRPTSAVCRVTLYGAAPQPDLAGQIKAKAKETLKDLGCKPGDEQKCPAKKMGGNGVRG